MDIIIHTAAYEPMEQSILQVQCSFTRGFSGLQLIGNTTEVCKSGLERARAALEKLGINIPQKRIVINICPASIRKDGSHFDLPFAIALATLITKKSYKVNPSRWLFAAELSLDGSLQPVKGIIAFALAALTHDFDGIIIASANEKDVSLLNKLQVGKSKKLTTRAFKSLKDILGWFEHGVYSHENQEHGCADLKKDSLKETKGEPNFDDMVLSPPLFELACVVATGLHSLLLHGAPGTGKSMFSARLTSILPPMSQSDHLESLKINSSISNTLSEQLLSGRPPFRSPHHQSSASAIMGIPEQPGELSLAHGGILFLDEFPEFRRDIIEALREPLETGHIRVSRAKKKVLWQAKVTLIAACNACPCGWLGSTIRQCHCPTNKIIAYRRKLSGPILDRIDLHYAMPEQSSKNCELFSQKHTQTSTTKNLRTKVEKARNFAQSRNESFKIKHNRDLKTQDLLKASGLSHTLFYKLLEENTPKHATRRTVIRSLRVARTLADLEEQACIESKHLKKAWSWLPHPSRKQGIDSAYGI